MRHLVGRLRRGDHHIPGGRARRAGPGTFAAEVRVSALQLLQSDANLRSNRRRPGSRRSICGVVHWPSVVPRMVLNRPRRGMLSRPAGTYGAQAPAWALKACSGANMLSRPELVPEPDPVSPGLESMPHVLVHWPKVVPRKLLKRLGRSVCQKNEKRCLILLDRCYNAWRRFLGWPGEKADAREGSPFLGHSVTRAGEARERCKGCRESSWKSLRESCG